MTAIRAAAVGMIVAWGAASALADNDALDRLNFGLASGFHYSTARFSDLDDRIFPSPDGTGSGNFGIFAEYEFGAERNWAVRAELDFLSRGFELNGIEYVTGTGIGELDYSLKAKYTDLRVPVIYQFMRHGSVRPYVYVAPVLGFVRGGEIKAEDMVSQYKLDVSDANMNGTYFAAALGAGVKAPIRIGSSCINVGGEVSYELGFSDTYGDKEKDGKARSLLFFPVYKIDGTRKFSGFELRAFVSVPLSIFGRSKQSGSAVRVVRYEPAPTVAVVEPSCYTLDEILRLLDLGRAINGKRICAIDQVNFEYNKSTLLPSSKRYLDKIAELMLRTRTRIEVRGHTDGVGSADYNLELSRRRAEAVVNYLLSKGVPEKRLSYSYYGMTRPIATNDTEEGRRQNRRVEFDIK